MSDAPSRPGEVRAGRSPARCALCDGDLADPAALAECAACGARHHRACFGDRGCASCGAAKPLLPEAARRAPGDPPAGSRIVVERKGDVTTYRWPRGHPHPVLWILMAGMTATFLFAPIAVVLFLTLYRSKPHDVTLGPELAEFTEPEGALSRATPVRIARSEIDAVRTDRLKGRLRVAIDAGTRRYWVSTGHPELRPLRDPEIEWLARAIDAWRRNGGR